MSVQKETWVLSIDGGGIRGLIPAVVLQYLEEQIGRPLSQCFDLIAGTSSGAVLAAGMAVDQDGKQKVPVSEFADFFFRDSPRVFRSSSASVLTNLKRFWGPIHDIRKLRSVLQPNLGDTMLSEVSNNILLTSYDMRLGQPVLFQSWLVGKGAQGNTAGRGLTEFCPITQSDMQDVKLIDAVLASSAVPTFFEPIRIPRGNDEFALVDGFVYALNPVMPAYFAARRLFGVDKAFRILSIGTGKYEKTYRWEQIKSWGATSWLRPMLEIFPDGISDASEVYMNWVGEVADIKTTRIQAVFDKEKNPGSPSPEMDDASPENLRRLADTGKQLIEDNLDALNEVINHMRAQAEV